MNRINDKVDYFFVFRNYFFSLFHFLWFKYKKFIQEVFCGKGALKLPKKQIQPLKNVYEGAHFTGVFKITKKELLHRNSKKALAAYL